MLVPKCPSNVSVRKFGFRRNAYFQRLGLAEPYFSLDGGKNLGKKKHKEKAQSWRSVLIIAMFPIGVHAGRLEMYTTRFTKDLFGPA